ncbi:lon protease homolog 2, peroxisomal isoform X2 [Halyomorpha halys]|uniref:lon protease homolog 2, peroxisomal isoform X2 n=1 Tax=Halyomorpha halys TaxID=286706 RepID=UPI0006D50D24|nr:lon protease homolog 2, peroxisomal-like isoform X2 [Halyomorpha halys]
MEPVSIPDKLPILTINNEVLLPGAPMKLEVGSNSNQSLMKDVLTKGLKIIGVIPFKDEFDAIKKDDVGTVALLVRISSFNYPEDTIIVMTLGLCRFIVKKVLSSTPYFLAKVELHKDVYVLENLKDIMLPVIDRIGLLPLQYLHHFKDVMDNFPASYIIDVCIHAINASFEEKLKVLKALDLRERIAIGVPLIMNFFGNENELKSRLSPERSLPSIPGVSVIKFKNFPFSQGKGMQRPYLGDSDLEELEQRLEKSNLPEHLIKIVNKDLEKLKRLSQFSPDNSVLRNYLEFVADLPWSVSSKETLDVKAAKVQLDIDHYGMEKLKKRIIEFLAVRQLKTNVKGVILCFIGPPGVGKTSIGRSIAHILNRKFQRISLGGVSNQSDIRGHRRTYIGAMPGRILHAIKTAGTNNPVILLDEIDKLGSGGYNGDPKAALLEVLDPEQNMHFTDHYLNLPFDLSNVTFIATANTARTIPAPLYDRLEVINVDGYTSVEKYHIAVKYLLPKQLDLHGLGPDMLQLTDDGIYKIINEYTKEAGVRSLERQLAAVCRSIAVKVAEASEDTLPYIIDAEHIENILGMAPYYGEEILTTPSHPGVALGLAWNGRGGTLLVVEAKRVPKSKGHKAKLILTGLLGSVMKESAQIAFNWVRSAAYQYGIVKEGNDLLEKSDIHIHFPEGAINKEGPSAGVTIATALISLFTGIPVTSGLAMTGELTLQGLVLPVGGIKEKLMAAHRAGIKRVIIPFKCTKTLADIPSCVLDDLKIITVKTMDDVIETAFEGLTSVSNHNLLSSKL